ncbi:MAG TPA: sulfatase-like hydrolase/transferase, partial [Erysipelotrichaceae bacterium]|nr:sulfatase-like hydrolase/transferase [Erysipelotrichaceae bacterium]
PFMLAYGMHSTHRPYPFEVADNIDERYVKPPFPGESNPGNRHDQALYLTSAQNADSNVKLLLDKLKEKDLLDKTVIMFTTDHGLALPYHKCNLKDSGIGISLIIKHPTSGHGEVCDSLVSHIDIFPTVCDLLGLEKPEGLEGLSFAKTFEDVYHKHRDEIFAQVNFHTSYEPTRCIRNERYKYIRYYDESWNKINLSNIDESKPKDFLLEHGLSTLEKPTEALYDCYFDPNEVNNLIAEPGLKEVVEDLRTKLFEQMEKTCDPLLKGEIEFKPHYKVNKKHCVKASSKNPDDYDPRGRWV